VLVERSESQRQLLGQNITGCLRPAATATHLASAFANSPVLSTAGRFLVSNLIGQKAARLSFGAWAAVKAYKAFQALRQRGRTTS